MNNIPETADADSLNVSEPDQVDAERRQEVPMFLQYWHAIFRHKIAALILFAAAIMIGIIATLLMTPYYTSTSRIEINRSQDKVTNVEGLKGEDVGQNLEFYQTQYSLMEAKSLAERVARSLNLAANDDLFELFDAYPDGLDELPSNSAAGRTLRLSDTIDILLDNMSVSPIRGSSLVDVSFQSPDAVFSSKVANSWVEQFIQSNLDRRFDSTADARKFLEERLAQLRVRLEESERQLVLYADNNEIVTLSSTQDADGRTVTQQTLASSDLSSLNGALAAATAARISAESEARQKGGDKNALTNLALNNIRQQRATVAAEYAKILVQFEPEYPTAQALASQLADLDASIATEEQRARAGTRARYLEALQRENQLRKKVNQLKSSFSGERRNSIQYNIYQREVDTNRQLYDGLLQRYKEIGVAGVGSNNISIVDEAAPAKRPSSPNLLLNLGLSLIAGVIFVAGYVFIAEQIDQTVKDPNDLKSLLGIASLGSVPDLDKGDIIASLEDKKSVAWEAYLSIRTNLTFLTEHGVPGSFLLTSTRPNEGKSTSAFALASVLSSTGLKVILLDGDMRNPSLHQMVGSKNDHGLSNYLSGHDSVSDLIVRHESYHFAVMTAGPIPPNAAELLSSGRMRELICQLEKDFDCVIIDAPPVLGLADIPLLASSVEGVIFTVEANGVKIKGIESAVRRIRATNATIFGGIVTKVSPQHSGYGYGYSYQYSYGEKANG
jgi:capsular exopolysaccharide synthesis family protein